ncbi:MAG: alpha/beta fold hydrolase [Candidatus Hodarchaeales archaeon]|jgi:pimeloyl-ACP methyl ester carboxylesterase
MPYFTRDKYRLYYHHSGNVGKNYPVVFIHGYLGSSRSHWGEQLDNLELNSLFEVIAPDLRGFAKSSQGKKVEKHKTEDHILDMHALLTEELKLKNNPIFIAYSIGGTLALLYTIKYHNTRAILLVSPRPFLSKTTRAWNFLAKEKRTGDNKNFLISQLWKVVKRIQKGISYIYTKRKRKTSKDYLKEISKLDIPIMMLHGNKDAVNPSIAYETLKEYLPPETEIIEFEGDHGITHEHPDVFNKILIDFLKAQK